MSKVKDLVTENEELKLRIRQLEHIIEGLNAQLLAESEEIHDLEDKVHQLEDDLDYDKIGT